MNVAVRHIEHEEVTSFYFPDQNGIKRPDQRLFRRVYAWRAPGHRKNEWFIQLQRHYSVRNWPASMSGAILFQGGMFDVLLIAARAIEEDKLLQKWAK